MTKQHKYIVRSVLELIPYANNSRTHSDEQINQVASSIKEFGFTNPVLIDEQGGIIAGHGRVMAAKKLGLTEVPCVELVGLTEAQKKAYVIADNQLALNSGWDLDMLKLEVDSLQEVGFDIDLLGFDEDFIDGLFPSEEVEGLTDEDAVPEPPETPVSVLGDIWQLGDHRLMCGDSTSIDAVDKLMDGHKADMVFTDPPYGVSYTGGIQNSEKGMTTNNREMIKNDDIDLYEDVVIMANTFSNGVVFMFFADTVCYGLYRGLEGVGAEIVALLVWKKKGGYGALGASYKPNHEPCLIWKPKGKKLNFIGQSTENRVWEIDKDGVNKLHPTQKPVEIPERAIGNHKADIVLDFFGGSGSTLIACEKLNRKARLMELDEKYVDVIINRWQNFTGKEAVHIESGKTYAEIKQNRLDCTAGDANF